MTTAEAKEIELVRAADPSARSERALRPIDRVFPELDARQRDSKLIEVTYRHDLAVRRATWLESEG